MNWFAFGAMAAMLLAGTNQAAGGPPVVYVGEGGLQAAIDAAPLYGTVVADRARQIEISTTVRIAKPISLVGLNARLKAGLGRTPIIEVAAEGVKIRDFLLEGNTASVSQEDRAPLIRVMRGRFVIENGETNHSSRDGVQINAAAGSGHIEHGVIRNLIARGTIRDAVSISGAGEEGLFVRHLMVENIRAYGSRLRGSVEVSDGSEYITVRDVYAESCAYGVDLQDHNRRGQVNRHIIIDGLHVKDTPIAVRTANHEFGHDGLTIRNVTGTDWPANARYAFEVRNTANVLIENVRIYGARGETALRILNSDNVTLRNLAFINCSPKEAALLVEDADNALIDNVVVQGKGKEQPEIGVLYRVRADEQFGGLRIRNVQSEGVRGTGIVLQNTSKSGTLASYTIAGNLATVRDGFASGRRLVEGNLPSGSGPRH
jgi:hypothetical protein